MTLSVKPSLRYLFFFFGLLIGMVSCNEHKSTSPIHGSTQKIDSLIKAGKKYQNSHIDSLLPIAEQLLTSSASLQDQKGLVYGQLYKAHYYWQSANHKKAMELALDGVSTAEKAKVYSALPEIYNLIANLHKENLNYSMAFKSQENGMKWAKFNKDTMAILASLSVRAMFIHTQRNASNKKIGIDTSINIQLGALKIMEADDKYEKMRIRFYNNVSQYYLENGNFGTSIAYANKAVVLANKYNQQRSLTYSYSWLGEAYFYSGEREKGIAYLKQGLAVAKDINEPYRIMEINKHMYDCYYSIGDYKTALGLNNIVQEMNDSLQVHVNQQNMSELQIKYESLQKDQKIETLADEQQIKSRQMILILCGCLLLIVLVMVLIQQYRILNRSHKQIEKSNQHKDQALQNIAYVQGHEIRKPLASIMGLITLMKAPHTVEEQQEYLAKLEESGKELDEKIHIVMDQLKIKEK